MKKIFSLFILIGFALTANAQEPSFSEDFNASCATATSIAFPFMVHNGVTTLNPQGKWMCAGTEGRDGTPGISCTGDYDGGYHFDSSYLITPSLNVSGYTGNIFLDFDSRTSFISGERIAVVESTDTTFDTAIAPITVLTMTPIVGPGDSTGWVTHQVDLSIFKSLPGFYIAFLYTSPDTYGTKWFLDNIHTTTFPLGVNNVQTEKLPLTIIGSPTETEIKVSFSTPAGGRYELELYNILGQTLSKRTLTTQSGVNSYSVDNLNLVPGMYFIKMGNGSGYGTTIANVQ